MNNDTSNRKRGLKVGLGALAAVLVLGLLASPTTADEFSVATRVPHVNSETAAAESASAYVAYRVSYRVQNCGCWYFYADYYDYCSAYSAWSYLVRIGYQARIDQVYR